MSRGMRMRTAMRERAPSAACGVQVPWQVHSQNQGAQHESTRFWALSHGARARGARVLICHFHLPFAGWCRGVKNLADLYPAKMERRSALGRGRLVLWDVHIPRQDSLYMRACVESVACAARPGASARCSFQLS